MLGTEPQIISDYVQTGQVKIVFWPVLNHGDPSVYSTLAAECVGQQSSDAFWTVHELLFTNQRDLWSAGKDYYANVAVTAGVDRATFEVCYDDPPSLEVVLALDNLRRQRGIFSQPTFDVNGQIIAGFHAYEVFAGVFDNITTP